MYSPPFHLALNYPGFFFPVKRPHPPNPLLPREKGELSYYECVSPSLLGESLYGTCSGGFGRGLFKRKEPVLQQREGRGGEYMQIIQQKKHYLCQTKYRSCGITGIDKTKKSIKTNSKGGGRNIPSQG